MRDWEQRAGELAREAIAAGDPTGWFDRLYAEGEIGLLPMPWDRKGARPPLVRWAQERDLRGEGRRAVVAGCGLGMDAEYIASLGYDTSAFDISETAIRAARARFPRSPVRYDVANLLQLPQEWVHAFDLVVEVYTVQALPRDLRPAATGAVASLVAPGGTLIVISASRDQGEEVAGPPWPLSRAEVEAFAADELEPAAVERRPDPDQHDVRRWQAEFRRAAP